MRLPVHLDFSLQTVLVSPEIRGRIQSRKADLLILPFRPQPTLSPGALHELELGPFAEDELLRAARIAFQLGLLQPPIAPIQIGGAFAISLDLGPAKLPRVGTGIVRRMGISRLRDLHARHWRRCGYDCRADFLRYWEQATADLPPRPNPWCWLIEFDYRG